MQKHLSLLIGVHFIVDVSREAHFMFLFGKGENIKRALTTQREILDPPLARNRLP